MPTDAKVAIVAALEREIRPLTKNWSIRRAEHDSRWFKFCENDGTVLVCGGIGAQPARRAAEAIISLYHPALIISAGFAGGLDPVLKIGEIFVPRYVIDASDGSRTGSGSGEGALLTFGSVADEAQKAKLAAAFGAQAVDMEAAAVARCAEAHGVRFLACKAISDTSHSTLPPIARFIAQDGGFRTAEFLAHVAVRPWLWPSVLRLQGNSAVAARKLSAALVEIREFGVAQPEQQGVY